MSAGPIATFGAPQAQPAQAQQNLGASSNEDPLLVALRQYITTGPDATNITTTELQSLYNDSIANAASKSFLETYLNTTSAFPACTWDRRVVMNGSVDITKTSFNFDIFASEISIGIKGDIPGLYAPFKGLLTGGTFCFNKLDDFQSGDVTFEMQKQGFTLQIAFYRSQVKVGSYECKTATFYMDPNPRRGNGKVY